MKAKIEAANQEAATRILKARPTLVDISTAGEAIPGMKKNMMLTSIRLRMYPCLFYLSRTAGTLKYPISLP